MDEGTRAGDDDVSGDVSSRRRTFQGRRLEEGDERYKVRLYRDSAFFITISVTLSYFRLCIFCLSVVFHCVVAYYGHFLALLVYVAMCSVFFLFVVK